MAVYILKRKTYSINPYKLTLSDLSLEFGIEFPDEIKQLSKMEKRIEADLHYWAMSAPGIDTVASPEMMYEVLSQGQSVIPALINNSGEVILYYDLNSGKYMYDGVQLNDPSAFVNTLITDLDKIISTGQVSMQDPEVTGGQAEVIKQEAANYTLYRDNVARTFGLPTTEDIAAQQEVEAQGQVQQ